MTMQEYSRIRISAVAHRTDALRPEMEKLQRAIKRVGENWNDVVAKGIQTAQINMIISGCNSINSLLTEMGANLNSDIERLEELSRIADQQ